jgi:hypothetical protein
MPSRRISEVGIAFKLMAGQSGVRILVRSRGFFIFSGKSRPAMGRIHSSVEWVPGVLPGDKAVGE